MSDRGDMVDSINEYIDGLKEVRAEMERIELRFTMHPEVYKTFLAGMSNHLRRWDMSWWYQTWCKVVRRTTEEDMVPIRKFLCKHDPEGKY